MKTKQSISLPTSGIVQVIESGNTSIAKLRQLLEENYLKLLCRLKYYTHICGAKTYDGVPSRTSSVNAHYWLGFFYVQFDDTAAVFPIDFFALRSGHHKFLRTGNGSRFFILPNAKTL